MKTTRNNHAKKTDRMAVLERNRPAVRSGLPPDGVALHEARVGGGFQQITVTRTGRNPAQGPVILGVDPMPQPLQGIHGVVAEPGFHSQSRRIPFTGVERTWEMGGMEIRRINGGLQVHAVMDVTKQRKLGPRTVGKRDGRRSRWAIPILRREPDQLHAGRQPTRLELCLRLWCERSRYADEPSASSVV